MDCAKGYVYDRYAIGALGALSAQRVPAIAGAASDGAWFQRLLLEAPLDRAHLPEVSNWTCSAEAAEDKAVYGTLLYSNLVVIFLPHYGLLCSGFFIKL